MIQKGTPDHNPQVWIANMTLLFALLSVVAISLILSKVLRLRGTVIGRMCYIVISAVTGGFICVFIEFITTGIPLPRIDDPSNRVWMFTFFSQGLIFGIASGLVSCVLLRDGVSGQGGI